MLLELVRPPKLLETWRLSAHVNGIPVWGVRGLWPWGGTEFARLERPSARGVLVDEAHGVWLFEGTVRSWEFIWVTMGVYWSTLTPGLDVATWPPAAWRLTRGGRRGRRVSLQVVVGASDGGSGGENRACVADRVWRQNRKDMEVGSMWKKGVVVGGRVLGFGLTSWIYYCAFTETGNFGGEGGGEGDQKYPLGRMTGHSGEEGQWHVHQGPEAERWKPGLGVRGQPCRGKPLSEGGTFSLLLRAPEGGPGRLHLLSQRLWETEYRGGSPNCFWLLKWRAEWGSADVEAATSVLAPALLVHKAWRVAGMKHPEGKVSLSFVTFPLKPKRWAVWTCFYLKLFNSFVEVQLTDTAVRKV